MFVQADLDASKDRSTPPPSHRTPDLTHTPYQPPEYHTMDYHFQVKVSEASDGCDPDDLSVNVLALPAGVLRRFETMDGVAHRGGWPQRAVRPSSTPPTPLSGTPSPAGPDGLPPNEGR